MTCEQLPNRHVNRERLRTAGSTCAAGLCCSILICRKESCEQGWVPATSWRRNPDWDRSNFGWCSVNRPCQPPTACDDLEIRLVVQRLSLAASASVDFEICCSVPAGQPTTIRPPRRF